MVRKKIKIARLPSESGRKVMYSSRKKGILKKVYGISTLCDIPAVLIMFSPSGKLDHFSSKPGIFDILQKYVYTDQITSEIDSESLEASKDVMDSIDYFSALYDTTNSSGEMVHDEKIEVMLQELQKKMMHPDSEAFHSIQEFEKLIRGLENVSRVIASTRNAGRPILMEQPQARMEDGMWGPLHGGEHIQQQVVGMFGLSTAPSVPWEIPSVHNVPIIGTKDPSLSLGGAPWHVPMRQLQGGESMWQKGVPAIGAQQNIHTPTSLFEEQHLQHQRVEMRGMEDPSTSLNASRQLPVQGGENILEQEVSTYGMGNLSLSSGRHFGTQRNIHTPTFMSEQIESQPFTDLVEASDDGVQWWDNFY